MNARRGRSSSVLRRLFAAKSTIVAPGVFFPLVARLAQATGFEAIYFSGGAFANSLSLPDLGTTTLTEVRNAIRDITATVDLPLIVDVDTGFGEAVNVVRTVREMESGGAAAIHIEDQVMPKRCGHLLGKQLVSVDEMVKKIIAAKESRKRDLILIARTDARTVEGFDSAIGRARIYLRAGADMIFPEALESEQEFAEFAKKVKVPLVANMTEFGKTPYIKVSEFEKMGYKLVIFPMSAFRAMLWTVRKTFEGLKKHGTQENMLRMMMTREQIYQLIDYCWYQETDTRGMNKARKLLRSNAQPRGVDRI
jgi:methylisocitrate lyase